MKKLILPLQCLLHALSLLLFVNVGDAQSIIPDSTFATNGIYLSSAGAVGTDINAILQQPDGKILMIGSDECGCLSMVRLNADGTMDTDFGQNGVVSAPIPSAEGGRGSALALQPDGKIVAGGIMDNNNPASWSGDDYFVLARFQSNGKLDSSFGQNGWATGSVGPNLNLAELIIQPDGKIVAVGGFAFIILGLRMERFLPDGGVDLSFGINGVAQDGPAATSAVAQQPDNKILSVGYTGVGLYASNVTRHNANGTLDSSFNINGSAFLYYGVDANAPTFANAVMQQPDGKILAGGSRSIYSGLTRFNTDGKIDSSFGEHGHFRLENVSGSITALALQADGKIMALIKSGYPALPADGPFTLLRLTETGMLDSSFGTNGIFYPTTSFIFGHKLLLQPDGKFLIAGRYFSSGTQGMLVARYRTDLSVSAPLPAIATTLVIQPNPASTCISITLSNGDSFAGEHSVWFTDVYGQTVVRQISSAGKIDISTLPKGLYFLQMNLARRYADGKFVKI